MLAFGFILVFSSDTLPWLGSIWLLVAGHVVLCLPYFLQTVVADMQRLGLATLEDAAESLGSNGVQRFLHVVLPSLRHSILSGLIIVAALSIGEFQFSNLVAGFLNRTYPVVLLQAFYGATGFACAATVILLVLALTRRLPARLPREAAAAAARTWPCYAAMTGSGRARRRHLPLSRHAARASATSTLEIAPGESSSASAPRAAARRRCCKLIAGFLRPDAARCASPAATSTAVGAASANCGIVFQATRCSRT